MTDETYNGYANRETWAFNLHWQNDQGMYNETLEQARQWARDNALARATGNEPTDYELGEHVVNYWREYIDTYEEEMGVKLRSELAMFRDEVGSWWRIDYAEVGAAVRESLGNED